ncbi:sugar ABC transporter permease [Candidatus Aerophobetes bacterium Ae_b3a]|nr:MAG: sugar ABC transporter permease [Candidatus Aerophobetes bacterium Ae_b3a]
MIERALLEKTAIYLVLIILAIIFTIPVFWMFSSSFKSLENTLTVSIKWLPEKLHFENYTEIWGAEQFKTYFLNSLVVAITVTFATVFLASLTGYGLSKFDFPGRQVIFLFILSTMMVPFQVIAIPLYIIVRYFGWIDTYQGLIIPGALTGFGVFFMKQYIQTISNEFIDVARIDGCSEFGIFWRIILPLSKPALAALGILTFLGSWNNLLWPLIVIQSEGLKTLPLGLAKIMQSEYGVRYNVLMSGAAIASAPMIIAFLIFQRRITKGITLGGLKG